MTANNGGVSSWIIRAEDVYWIAEPVRVGPPRPENQKVEPTITVYRENGAVRAVDLTCVCGRTYRIWCEEEPPRKPTADHSE
jgi:hypothetical protein